MSKDDLRRAVFLSYASQDAERAGRICEALRAAGVEVWFDRSELRGGDQWDAKIKRQIRECALFVPIISAATQSRPEGYFRFEWKLAVDRSHLMADDQPFLLPVVIDEIDETTARVPDKFREVQWTRVKLDETPAQFSARVRALLDGGHEPPPSRNSARSPRVTKRRGRAWPWIVGTAAAFVLLHLLSSPRQSGPEEVSKWIDLAQKASENKASSSQPVSESRQLVERARTIFDRGDLTRENLRTAEELCTCAIELDPTDAEAWAARAQIHAWFVFYRYDYSEKRKGQATADASRAMNLAPESYEARFAHAAVLTKVNALPASRPEAEQLLRSLAAEKPADARVSDHLGLLFRAMGRQEEAADFFHRANNPAGAAWTYYEAGEFSKAMDAVDRALQNGRSVSSLILKASLEYSWREDLEAAQAIIDQLPGSTLLDDSYALTTIRIALFRRESQKALEMLRALPGDYVSAVGFTGPKAALMAFAHEIAKRPEAARAEWRVALNVAEQRFLQHPNEPLLVWWKATALAGLGDRTAAEENLRLALQLAGAPLNYVGVDTSGLLIRLGRHDDVLEWLELKLKRERSAGWERIHASARFDSNFDPLRGNPRFETLLRETLPSGAKPMSGEYDQ